VLRSDARRDSHENGKSTGYDSWTIYEAARARTRSAFPAGPFPWASRTSRRNTQRSMRTFRCSTAASDRPGAPPHGAHDRAWLAHRHTNSPRARPGLACGSLPCQPRETEWDRSAALFVIVTERLMQRSDVSHVRRFRNRRWTPLSEERWCSHPVHHGGGGSRSACCRGSTWATGRCSRGSRRGGEPQPAARSRERERLRGPAAGASAQWSGATTGVHPRQTQVGAGARLDDGGCAGATVSAIQAPPALRLLS